MHTYFLLHTRSRSPAKHTKLQSEALSRNPVSCNLDRTTPRVILSGHTHTSRSAGMLCLLDPQLSPLADIATQFRFVPADPSLEPTEAVRLGEIAYLQHVSTRMILHPDLHRVHHNPIGRGDQHHLGAHGGRSTGSAEEGRLTIRPLAVAIRCVSSGKYVLVDRSPKVEEAEGSGPEPVAEVSSAGMEVDIPMEDPEEEDDSHFYHPRLTKKRFAVSRWLRLPHLRFYNKPFFFVSHIFVRFFIRKKKKVACTRI